MDIAVFATLKKLIGKKTDSTDETVNGKLNTVINNTSASTGLACMMMSGTKDKEASWEFMQLNWYGKRIRRKCYGRNGYE